MIRVTVIENCEHNVELHFTVDGAYKVNAAVFQRERMSRCFADITRWCMERWGQPDERGGWELYAYPEYMGIRVNSVERAMNAKLRWEGAPV